MSTRKADLDEPIKQAAQAAAYAMAKQDSRFWRNGGDCFFGGVQRPLVTIPEAFRGEIQYRSNEKQGWRRNIPCKTVGDYLIAIALDDGAATFRDVVDR